MWKARPVIGGDVGGIRIQVEDGINGYLVNSPEECAERIVALLNDSDLRSQIGQAASESVRQQYLLPRLALDYLKAAVARKSSLSHGNGTNGHRRNSFADLELLRLEGPPVAEPEPVPIPVPVRRRRRQSVG